MVGDGVAAAAAFTGRANLYAESAGVTAYDPARLNAFNLVDEAATLALLPPYQAVAQGQMMGTLKILPFAVPEDVVHLTEWIARGDPPIVAGDAFRPPTEKGTNTGRGRMGTYEETLGIQLTL